MQVLTSHWHSELAGVGCEKLKVSLCSLYIYVCVDGPIDLLRRPCLFRDSEIGRLLIVSTIYGCIVYFMAPPVG